MIYQNFKNALSGFRLPAGKPALGVWLLALALGLAPAALWADSVTHTITVGTTPQEMAITPDGSTLFVANSGSSTVSVISTSTFTVSSTITLAAAPFGLAVTPNGSELWVALSGASEVAVYDLPGLGLHTGFTNPISLGVGAAPAEIAFKHNGAVAYITDQNHNTVIPVQVSTGATQTTLSVGSQPNGIAVAFNAVSGANTVFVANFGSGTVSWFNPSVGTVSSITVGTKPFDVAASSDGSTVYVTNFGDNTFSIIDVASATVTATISTLNSGTGPKGVTVKSTTAGDRVYIAMNTNNTVSKYKGNGVFKASISVGSSPVGMAAILSDNFIYCANSGGGTVSVIDDTL